MTFTGCHLTFPASFPQSPIFAPRFQPHWANGHFLHTLPPPCLWMHCSLFSVPSDRYSVRWCWCLGQSQLYSSHSSNNPERPPTTASITLNCNKLLRVFLRLYWEFPEGKGHVWFCSLLIPLHLAQTWYAVEAKKYISWMKEMNNKWKYKQTNEWEKGLISLFNAEYRVWYSQNLVCA